MLTGDGFGVMGGICKVSKDEGMYDLLSGLRCKVGGREGGVSERQPSF